ncbi:hypothetical protein EDD22DRAFT_950608 [Suillus occidentalis]|nr:hypothetical protein EDD22DRAFT_950608 [Suillus occidentalis]
MLVGPGVPPKPYAQCFSARSVRLTHTSLSTLGSPTITPIPLPLPDLPLMSVSGALFWLPETLSLTITPYYGDADADIRTVNQDEDLYKEIVHAMADDCYVYLCDGILYNMPAVPATSGPYYCVTHGRHIGVFNHWDEAKEYIEGFSEVAYAVVSLTVGELLVRNAIKKGEFYNSQIRA